MTLAELIYQHSLRLPEPAAREALDFIEFLEQRYGVSAVEGAGELSPARGARPPGRGAHPLRRQADPEPGRALRRPPRLRGMTLVDPFRVPTADQP